MVRKVHLFLKIRKKKQNNTTLNIEIVYLNFWINLIFVFDKSSMGQNRTISSLRIFYRFYQSIKKTTRKIKIWPLKSVN